VLEIGAGSGLLSIIAERDRERNTYLGLYPQLPRLIHRHGNRINVHEVNDYLSCSRASVLETPHSTNETGATNCYIQKTEEKHADRHENIGAMKWRLFLFKVVLEIGSGSGLLSIIAASGKPRAHVVGPLLSYLPPPRVKG